MYFGGKNIVIIIQDHAFPYMEKAGRRVFSKCTKKTKRVLPCGLVCVFRKSFMALSNDILLFFWYYKV